MDFILHPIKRSCIFRHEKNLFIISCDFTGTISRQLFSSKIKKGKDCFSKTKTKRVKKSREEKEKGDCQSKKEWTKKAFKDSG